jgi:hypothetical protein
MSKTVNLFSEVYSPVKLTHSFSAGVTESLWKKILENESAGRTFLRIQSDEKEWICPVGQPVSEQNLDDAIFLPNWMISVAGFKGEGEFVTITDLEKEAFPEATKLVLRVVDSAFYNSQVKEELEQSLSEMGVVKKHTLLQIPIHGLGGFEIEVFVAHTEPADTVLCDGDEVVVEFEEPVDQVHVPQRPPTPIPPPPLPLPLPIEEEDRSILPFTRISTGEFVPFQGEGRTLGSSNTGPPDWRKDCPPKKKL